MRVLIWTDAYSPEIGGLEVFCQRMIEGLKAQEHTCLVVANCDSESAPRYEVIGGTAVHRFAFHQALVRADLLAFRLMQEECERIVTAFAPDVIHLNVCFRALLSFALLQRSHRRPAVMTLHDRHLYRNLTPLSREIFSYADRVVAVSEFIWQDALHHFPELGPKLSTIRNALPGTPAEPAPPPATPRLLAIGRLTVDKGFDLAIEAFAEIAVDFPEAQLTLVGDGEQRAQLENLAAGLDIIERVDFLGWRDPDQINALIDSHAGVIMPSRWQEPFGLVALQAAQRGRPVCAARSGGLPEIVREGATGWLFDCGSSEDLARSLRLLLEDTPRRQKMGQCAHEHARQDFDYAMFLQRYEALFAEVASE